MRFHCNCNDWSYWRWRRKSDLLQLWYAACLFSRVTCKFFSGSPIIVGSKASKTFSNLSIFSQLLLIYDLVGIVEVEHIELYLSGRVNFFFLDLMLTILSSFVVWSYHCMVTRYSWSRTYWAISEWACNFFFLDLMLTILSNFVVRANHCIPCTLSISPSSFCFVLTVFGLLVCFFL